jgi:hypothetical protein
MTAANAVVDFDSARGRDATTDPFPHLIVPGFVRAEAQRGIDADFPVISHPGSFPLASVKYGANFSDLIDALTGKEMASLVEDKLGVDLTKRPTMVTVRGISKAADGQIHTDSRTKLVTILLYMNQEWESGKGRLRLLRSPDNLQDYVAEVPPDRGTLLMFRNDENAWHGFEPFEGPRRVIQVNWVKDEGVVRRERSRHRFSAFMKRLFGRAKH